MTTRAFLAFTIPDWVRDNVAKLVDDLKTYDEEVRWTNYDQLHVTLRFLGAVDADQLSGPIADCLAKAMAATKPVALDCGGVGVFPHWKHPRVIWAGFSGEADPLFQLHETLATALQTYNIPKDARALRLHLTLGRAKGKGLDGQCALVKRVESLGPMHFGEVTVDHLTLFKSQLTKTGSVYTPLRTFDLG